MGKRTSDFVALAAILGGAGLGIALTSLFARTAPVAQVDDVSTEVHVVRGRVMLGMHPRALPSTSEAELGRTYATGSHCCLGAMWKISGVRHGRLISGRCTRLWRKWRPSRIWTWDST